MWSVCSSSRTLPSSPIFAWACANSIDVFYVFKKVLSLNRRASTRQEPMALSNYLWQQECIFSPNTAIANQITPLNHISVSRQLDIFQRTKEIFVTSILNVSRKAHILQCWIKAAWTKFLIWQFFVGHLRQSESLCNATSGLKSCHQNLVCLG